MVGYRDNQWYFPNTTDIEGVAGKGGLTPTPRDNEPFLYPGNSAYLTREGIGPQTPASGKQTKGFIRSLNRIAGITDIDRRFFFQFNPPAIMRNLVMNTDMLNPLLLTPGELTLPVPGQANFSFEIMLDRQMEVNAGINYTLGDRSRNIEDLVSDKSSPYDIGVLADINVLDKVIGVGIDPDAVATQLRRAQIQFANQASDSKDPSSESTITNISNPVKQADNTYRAVVQHATKDFVQNGDVVSIGGCFPIGFNSAGLTVSEVKNTTPYEFVVFYQSSPGASVTANGSVSKAVSGDTTATTDTGFDEAQVAQRLTNLGSESNRAFLIPNPVRVVFSSLYMVDGYVTAVNLLFTKFSRNMVPVTATLSLQMEARYIGFAREKTFLTEVLEQAKEPSEDGVETPPTDTVVNNRYYALRSAMAAMAEDYRILLCGTDNDDNPEIWTKVDDNSSDNYNIQNVLSFTTVLVRFGFAQAFLAHKDDSSADDYKRDNNSFMRYLAEGNIKSISHQIDSLKLTRKDTDPSEGTNPVVILEIGPVVAPQSYSFEDFKDYGALGGGGAKELSSVTDVANTKLTGLLSGGLSSEEAKDRARGLYFLNAVPNGKSLDSIKIYLTAYVTFVVTDNDGNTITMKGKVEDKELGNRKQYAKTQPKLEFIGGAGDIPIVVG